MNVTSTNQCYNSSSKPGFLKSVGKGIGTGIKSLIPIYGLYMVGDEFSKVNASKENLENIQKGKLEYKKESWLEKTAKGLGNTILYFVPIVGTYVLGKTKNDKENLKNEIAGRDTKEAGVFKNFFTGLGEKIKLSLPLYNVYYIGKESIEATNIKNGVDKIFTDSVELNFKKNASAFDKQLAQNIQQIYTLADVGLIDKSILVKIEEVIGEIAKIDNDANLSEITKNEKKAELTEKLCVLTGKI